MGEDVTYSGTVAAAIEGAICEVLPIHDVSGRGYVEQSQGRDVVTEQPNQSAECCFCLMR